MTEEKNNHKKVFIIIVIIAILCIIAGSIILFFNNNNKTVKPSNNSNTNTNINTNGDYNEMSQNLVDKINSGEMKVYMKNCEEKDGKEVDSNKELSGESVKTFFDMLNKASNIETGTIEAYCPKYTYVITTDIKDKDKTVLAAWYGNDNKTLLFGIGEDGYVATFSDDNALSGFLENLE